MGNDRTVGSLRKLAAGQTALGVADGACVDMIAKDREEDALIVNEFLRAVGSFINLELFAGGRVEGRDRSAVAGRAIDRVANGCQAAHDLGREMFDVQIHRMPIGKPPLPQHDAVEGVARDQSELARQRGVFDGRLVFDGEESASRRDQALD